MEEYYNAALTEVEKDSWGPNLKIRATPDAKKIVFLHEFKECYIVLDGHFTLEIVSKAHATAVKVTFGCTCVALVRRQPQDNLGVLSP
jgi:hypothetical protein